MTSIFKKITNSTGLKQSIVNFSVLNSIAHLTGVAAKTNSEKTMEFTLTTLALTGVTVCILLGIYGCIKKCCPQNQAEERQRLVV